MTVPPSIATFEKAKKIAANAEKLPRRISLEEYYRSWADREDGFKYEFVRGRLVKSESNMHPKQYFIVYNLLRAFLKTKASENGDALAVELEQSTGPQQIRKPDLCYYPEAKLLAGALPIDRFAIEIISPTDRNDDIVDKRIEYFAAGMEVLWQIDPKSRTVTVFTSPQKGLILSGSDVCSAAPVVPDFEMTVDAVFFKKA